MLGPQSPTDKEITQMESVHKAIIRLDAWLARLKVDRRQPVRQFSMQSREGRGGAAAAAIRGDSLGLRSGGSI